MEMHPIAHPETMVTAIRIGSPVSWKKALKAVYGSKGLLESITDREIFQAQSTLARLEGMFIEPFSATSTAGVKKLAEIGLIEQDEQVVCIATGHGLKDPDIIIWNYKLQKVNLERKTNESIISAYAIM